MKKSIGIFLLCGLSWSAIAVESKTAEDVKAEKERSDELRRSVESTIQGLRKSACEKDVVAVLSYFWSGRENWTFDTGFNEMAEYIQKKYGREATAADQSEGERLMREMWRDYFAEIRKDVKKGKASNFCGLEIVSIKEIYDSSVMSTQIKYSDGSMETWYLAISGQPTSDENRLPPMKVDQTTKTRKLMKKHFPYVKFALDWAEKNESTSK